MSVNSRRRKQEYRQLKVFRENADAKIGNTFIYRVHEIPETIHYGTGCDFWIIDKKGCYLLTVEKSQKNEIQFWRRKTSDTLHCWLKQDLDKFEIEKHLKVINAIGVPYKMKGRLTVKM